MSNGKQGALYAICYVLNVEREKIDFLSKLNESELDALRAFVAASNDASFKAGASRVTKRQHQGAKTERYISMASKSIRPRK